MKSIQPKHVTGTRLPAGIDTDTVQLASGGWLTGHGDFLNAWDPVALDREVRVCLRRGKVCGVSRGGEQP
mgnify:CR=1 FL=1